MMQITDAAKKILGEALAEQQCNALRLHTQSSCCGRSLQFELAVLGAEGKAEMINGLSVLMDDDTRKWTGTVTVDADGEKLTLINSESCCS